MSALAYDYQIRVERTRFGWTATARVGREIMDPLGSVWRHRRDMAVAAAKALCDEHYAHLHQSDTAVIQYRPNAALERIPDSHFESVEDYL